jgi:adenylate cyclase
MLVDLSEELLVLARSVDDPLYLIGTHWELGCARFFLGQFLPAREHLEQCFGLYDPQQHRAHASLFGFDLGVFCLCFSAHTLWHLGYPQQALQKSQEAVALSYEVAHPISQVVALAYTAMLHQFRLEEHAAQEQAERAVAIWTEQGFACYLAWAVIIQGWALSARGQLDEGLRQMRQGIAA